MKFLFTERARIRPENWRNLTGESKRRFRMTKSRRVDVTTATVPREGRKVGRENWKVLESWVTRAPAFPWFCSHASASERKRDTGLPLGAARARYGACFVTVPSDLKKPKQKRDSLCGTKRKRKKKKKKKIYVASSNARVFAARRWRKRAV